VAQHKKSGQDRGKITEEVALDREGILYAETGLPERRIIEAFGDEISLDDLRKKFTESEINISLGWLRRKKQAILERGIVKIISREKMPDEKLLERIKQREKSRHQNSHQNSKQA